MPTPFEIHAETQAEYLAWLSGLATDGSDPNSSVPVFTFSGTDYACNFSMTSQAYLDAGGRVPVGALVLEVLEPMTSVPVEGKDRITLLGKDWRVQIVKTAAGKNPQLTCWDPNRGA